MASLSLRNVYKVYDGNVVAVSDFNLEIEDKEFIIFVGPSGCGKSTTLRMIAGLEEISKGELYIGDVLSNDISPKDRDIAMVFQYSALFDSLNVADNISFALRERKDLRNKYNEKDLKSIVSQKLELVGLKGIEDKFPSELSGGMQKRVSFARAIVTEPNSILYDEPTSGLDPISSTLIEDYIVRLKDETKAASIVVTHQMSTITRTADRVIMLYEGKIVFEGTPEEMLKQDTEYTKQFVTASLEGPMKMIA